MSLKEYKRKRDFHKTPEPAGGRKKSGSGLQFVIQKHAASRLHYDFRLEHDGTLKSWAVPKGPSLDPAVKSLAVQVEDHPIEYATFEGVIPQGEYGGGTVMVWDRGTWEPEVDPDRGLRTGKLKFRLDGEKLHGSWALVRMGGRAGEDGKNWLLIKHRDDEAKPLAKFDVLKRKDRSVISGRDMEQIADDADAVWSSNGKSARNSKTKSAEKKKRAAAAKKAKRPLKKNGKNGKSHAPLSEKDLASLPGASKASFPKDFTPQLATLTDRVPAGDNWLHELKFDGYRILALVRNGKVNLVTRRGNDWTARFQSVADAVAELPLKSAILDGEVVSLDEHGISNFQQLQNLMKRGDKQALVYYVFDLPYLEGFDLTETPLLARKEVLAGALLSANPDNDGTARFSDHIQGSGEQVLAQACRSAMEGIVAKRADSAYHQYRSPDWLKVKCLKQQEFVIGGYTKPEGARVGFGALLVGYYDGGDLIYAGKVGTGFTTQSLKELTAELNKRKIDKSPFKNPPKGFRIRGVTWVKPELVGEIEFTEWTSDGSLRHPSFQGLREDKPAKEVVREMAKKQKVSKKQEVRGPRSEVRSKTSDRKLNGSAKRSPSKEPGRNGQGEIKIAGVRLTNPGRVLYPEEGLTKRDLAEYYERIADWILPYVVARPLTLVRCPEGHMAECFFQKHLTGTMPDSLHGVDIKEKGKKEEYVGISDLAGLISLVQMGTLELHPWPAREDNVERPDFFVFDLDPGEGTGWKDVIHGALELRERLERVGLKTFLRTSGGKGLHVVVPIERRTTWEDFKQFAKNVADTMTREAPDRYIATLSKAKRRGKIFVDYLRNQRGATAIASYSTRRRSGAPVATPIAWDELSAKTRPDMFNIKNLPKRLDKLKNDPWADFFTTRQSINAKIQAAFTA
jgi:bifunctional non-homologous end joining protein LigD